MVKNKNRIIKNIFFIKLVIAFVFGFADTVFTQSKSLINTAHLDHLYEKITVQGETMGIIRIYADYPDYNYTEAKGEGIACVDDAARAEIFYIRYYHLIPDSNVLSKIENLTNFLLHMQAANGFFYNFIWKDHTIDSTYKTSVAKPDWWTWRAIWALSEAGRFFEINNKQIADKIKPQLDKAVNVTLMWLSKNRYEEYEYFEGFKIPAWLPHQFAADQAAILTKGLSLYYDITKNLSVKKEILELCDGIIKMQFGNADELPHYAFLSWQNTWHEWGNSQADALICAGKEFNKKDYFKYAGNEIKYFYPYMVKEKYFNAFTVSKHNSGTKLKDVEKFSQIAYGIRPMVFASMAYYKQTHDRQAAVTAGKIACWLLGDNIAGTQMYNPETGICFDGIISSQEVNKNSGAESTIEALLSILEVEQNPISKKIIWKYYKHHRKN